MTNPRVPLPKNIIPIFRSPNLEPEDVKHINELVNPIRALMQQDVLFDEIHEGATYGKVLASELNDDGTIDPSAIDHGGLSGLADDDHTQYLLIAGTRAMTGDLGMGSNDINLVKTIGGWIGTLTVEASAAQQLHLKGSLIQAHTDYLQFHTFAGAEKVRLTMATDLSPRVDGAMDLGTNTIAWGNIYGTTLYGDGSNLTGTPDEKVKIDAAATAGYIGAAANDGVLRAGALLTYTDGGDFVTLNVDEASVDHDALTNTHNLTTDIDHDAITNTHNLTTDIDHNAITNTHNLTTDIDHDAITNTHNLTTDIDHNDLANLQGGTAAQYYHLTNAQHTAALAVSTTYLPLAGGTMSGDITMAEDGWIGIGAAIERIIFNGGSGKIEVHDSEFWVYSPDATKYWQMYNDNSNSYLKTNDALILEGVAGAQVVMRQGAAGPQIKITNGGGFIFSSGAGDPMQAIVGGTFTIEDVDPGFPYPVRWTCDSANGNVLMTGTLTGLTSLNINASTSVTGIIDDDTMGTAAATNLATAESVKAYVDTRLPSGSITMFGAAAAPTGWLLCDGAAVSRSTYSVLFGIIGTTYGIGDGSTTFNVPDMENKFPVGAGDTYSNADTGGSSTHSLSTAELATHTHQFNYTAGQNVAGGAFAMQINPVTAPNPVTAGTAAIISNTGSGTAHENKPPYVGVTFIIKT